MATKHHFGANQFHDAVTGVAGSANNHFVTKSQLDAVANGKFWKDACRAVATSNVNIAGGGLANGQTVDGVTLATGERVLLTGQTTGSQNGIYIVPASGAASRAADMAAGVASAGFWVPVTEGTTYHDSKWYVASDKGADIVGTDALTITQDTSGGTYTADGSTLRLVGSEFSVKPEGITATELATSVAGAGLTGGDGTPLAVQVDGASIEISTDLIQVKAGGIQDSHLASSAVTTVKIADANVTDAKLASDSVTTAKILDSNVTAAKLASNSVQTAKINDSAVTTAKINDAAVTTAKVNDSAVTLAKLGSGVKGYETDVGNGSSTSFALTHSLGTRKVRVTVYDNTNYDSADVAVRRTSTNQVTLDFGGYTPSSNEFHVIVEPCLV